MIAVQVGLVLDHLPRDIFAGHLRNYLFVYLLTRCCVPYHLTSVTENCGAACFVPYAECASYLHVQGWAWHIIKTIDDL